MSDILKLIEKYDMVDYQPLQVPKGLPVVMMCSMTFLIRPPSKREHMMEEVQSGIQQFLVEHPEHAVYEFHTIPCEIGYKIACVVAVPGKVSSTSVAESNDSTDVAPEAEYDAVHQEAN